MKKHTRWSIMLGCLLSLAGWPATDAIAEIPYCDTPASSFEPPLVDCMPPPAEGCFYTVNAVCYGLAKSNYQSEMKAIYDRACVRYFEILSDYHSALGSCQRRAANCGADFDWCSSQYNECIQTAQQNFDREAASLAQQVAEESAGAEAAFVADVQECCELHCETPR